MVLLGAVQILRKFVGFILVRFFFMMSYVKLKCWYVLVD